MMLCNVRSCEPVVLNERKNTRWSEITVQSPVDTRFTATIELKFPKVQVRYIEIQLDFSPEGYIFYHQFIYLSEILQKQSVQLDWGR